MTYNPKSYDITYSVRKAILGIPLDYVEEDYRDVIEAVLDRAKAAYDIAGDPSLVAIRTNDKEARVYILTEEEADHYWRREYTLLW